jgi:hypothetical protein
MTQLRLWSLTASFGESESHTHGHAAGTARADGCIDSAAAPSSASLPLFVCTAFAIAGSHDRAGRAGTSDEEYQFLGGVHRTSVVLSDAAWRAALQRLRQLAKREVPRHPHSFV